MKWNDGHLIQRSLLPHAFNSRGASHFISQQACSFLSLLNSQRSIQPLDTELPAGASHSTIAISAYCRLPIHTWWMNWHKISYIPNPEYQAVPHQYVHFGYHLSISNDSLSYPLTLNKQTRVNTWREQTQAAVWGPRGPIKNATSSLSVIRLTQMVQTESIIQIFIENSRSLE